MNQKIFKMIFNRFNLTKMEAIGAYNHRLKRIKNQIKIVKAEVEVKVVKNSQEQPYKIVDMDILSNQATPQ